jgi:hypothetical protein
MRKWVELVFNRPVTRHDANRLMNLNPTAPRLQRLAQIFEDPSKWLNPYPDDSIDQAFWQLSYKSISWAIRDESIDLSLRLRFISSFEPLFRDFFAAHCQPVLGWRSEAGNPLNSSCYMWFDICCRRVSLDVFKSNPVDSALIESMRSILAIDHVACQESAIHGLGHFYKDCPVSEERDIIESVIDAYIGRNPRLREELRLYADHARVGRML